MAVNSISDVLERVRGIDLEHALGLRPARPQVALALDGREVSLVRLKKGRRRAGPTLEAQQCFELDEAAVPTTLSDQNGAPGSEFGASVLSAYEALGVRPGSITLVLPDNLAKISLLTLPERPPTRRQLLEVIRFKMHRAVPFRFSEAALSFQIIPGKGPGLNVLVALMRRELVERYERILEGLGARPGLVDLCTPNLLNLCRDRVNLLSKEEGDVALLNCTANYFSLIIMREGQLIFYRCKNYSYGGSQRETLKEILAREVAGSFSYYREKLEGERIGLVLVRTVETPYEEILAVLQGLELEAVEPIDPLAKLALAEGISIDPQLAQRLAPVIGATLGRG